ncbi:hypothetical protein [Wolbachia endosymbiont (group B) of Athalia cordata]|nr:hypothetical protein [Wolbachia endosymbiont (group B) of Athalia cordata]
MSNSLFSELKKLSEMALLHGSSKKNWKLLTEIIIKQVFNHQYASQNEGQ